jgi:hypothetical protein
MCFGIKHKVLTVVLSRADLAAAAGEKNRFCARGLRALGLDVLAAHPPHHSPLLVDLGEHVHIVFSTRKYRARLRRKTKPDVTSAMESQKHIG